MIASKLTIPQFEKNQVGQVSVSITVANHIDQILAERGFIPAAEVRKVTLDKVLIDTGATMLSLPVAIVDALGLPVRGQTTMKTAAGPREARIFREADLIVNSRQGTFDCLELTDIDQPLLGVLPLESLGLEPDLQSQSLRVLPMEGDDTYIYAM